MNAGNSDRTLWAYADHLHYCASLTAVHVELSAPAPWRPVTVVLLVHEIYEQIMDETQRPRGNIGNPSESLHRRRR
ncbi:hypothetical protein CERSUDRAFT_119275 [Gelatoporia subvermispora B]|uniref:Uncharacterized protein n=1 Tax=Ceriporiopsis subvermispora (strain B) TaxID=914234 RepID=M2Q577_CERS8|nr:hypothetical protein CERSUDRAFT_119275 [Gelatoporia subvermispora B]